MSVPRPAIFVAIVTAPTSPAFAIISASLAWFLAFKTSCLIPALSNILDNLSFVSTEIVPTSIGCPVSCICLINSTIFLNLPASVAYIISDISFLTHGLLVGIWITYML